MIQSNRGSLKIEGSNFECLADFQHIYTEMMKLSPEIVLAVTGAFLDEAQTALEETDEELVKSLLAISLKIKNNVEGENNND